MLNLTFKLGEAGMPATLKMTFAKKGGQRTPLDEGQNPEKIVLENPITSGESIMEKGICLTSVVIGIRDFQLDLFEIETNNAFYTIQF